MARIIKVGGVGIPNIDAYVPRLSLLEAGLDALNAIAASNPSDKNKHDIEKVNRAKEARAQIYDYLDSKGGIKKGAKDELDDDFYRQSKDFVVAFAEAARVVNPLLMEKGLPPLKVKHLGGTTANKLNAYKAGRGDNINAFIIGVVGNDANGVYIKDLMKARGIEFLDNDIRCDETQMNYIVTEDRAGHTLGDRHILKGRSNALQILAENEEYILAEVGKLDRLMIEGGEISSKKFGHDLFRKIIDTAIADDMDLAFSPCTSLAARQEHPGNDEVLDRARLYKHNDMPTVFNLQELFNNYLPPDIRKGMKPSLAETADLQQNPYFLLALSNLKLELSHREKLMPTTNNQPIAIVSNGSGGVYILTSKAEQTLKVPAPKNVKVVDTTGAGDNLTAGAFIKATQIANHHRNFNIGKRQELSDEELVSIARFAQEIAKLAVQQYGATVDQDAILRELQKDAPVPKKAKLKGITRIGSAKEVVHGK